MDNSRITVWKPTALTTTDAFDQKVQGACKTGEMTAVLGQRCPTFTYLQLTEKGSRVDLTIRVPAAREDVTLEMVEVHDRKDPPLAYWVGVNGETVYYRTYAPCCDGANHYFLRLPALAEDGVYRLSIQNDNHTPVRFHAIYAYPDAACLAAEQQVEQPMTLGLFTPGLSGSKEKDLENLRVYQERYGAYPLLFSWEVYYIRHSREELYQKLDYLLELSSETGVPVAINLNSWWSGTPVGMDGRGGNWRDLTYHQVLYDPENVTGRGIYQLTTPNYWRDMPWLTMSEPYYNDARQQRLTDATAYLKRRIAAYRAEGKALPPVSIFTENEPDYWHYGAWHDSARSVPGVEPCSVKAAARDGVKLDPASGMDDAQRAWLWKNLTDYIVGVGEAIEKGVGADATVVSGGVAALPDNQLIEHCYTHATTGTSNQPYEDMSRSMWETHLIDSLRLGYQGGPGEGDSRCLDYATCYGRLAGVNKEQIRESTYSILPYAYLYGADFQMIFNFKHCEPALMNAPKPADYANRPVPVHSYDRRLTALAFDCEENLKSGEVLLSQTRMNLSTARGTFAAAPVEETGTEGTMLFKIHSPEGFPHGLITVFNATVNFGSEDVVEFGYSPEEFVLTEKLVGRHQYINDYIIDWSDCIDRTAQTVYVKLHIPGGKLKTEYNSYERNSICRFEALSPLPTRSGHTNDFRFTFSQLRSLYRLTERREDARRLLASYPAGAEKDALIDRFDRGEYQTVYDALLMANTRRLPADFYVKDNGPLAPWSIEVSADGPVWLTLLEAGETGYRLKAEALERPVTLRVMLDGHLVSGRVEDGVLCVRPDVQGEKAFAWPLTPIRRQLPEIICGRLMRLDNGVARVQSQDAQLTFFSDYVPLPVAEDCRCYLAEDGGEERPVEAAEITDRLAVILHTDGEKIREIHGFHGRITGTVTAVTEACIVGEIRLPTVTVTDGKRTVTAVIGAECALDFTGASGKALHISYIGRLGLEPGVQVELSYLPAIANGHIRALKIGDVSAS